MRKSAARYRKEAFAETKVMVTKMELSGPTYKVLVVSSSNKVGESIVSRLPEDLYSPVTLASSVADARMLLPDGGYDIVIINSPRTSGPAERFASEICEKSCAGVLLLLTGEDFVPVSERVAPFGVMTLEKPISDRLLLCELAFLRGMRERMRNLEIRTASVEEKMEEVKVVNRAKWLLIDQLKMTEPSAHRYIEKTAMDRCVSKREIAEIIIRTYR